MNTSPELPGAAPPARLMTIRVSRDSGKTYGAPIEVRAGDDLPPMWTSIWPPCGCPQHRDDH